ncbi:MAG: DUF4826 family protein [Xanthomonadales bacterium]|nr:DUF4826 family protein [Xanthomonadales bacterium]
MNEKTKQAGREELDAWVKKNLNAAVHKLMARGNIDSLVVEGKAAWVLPFQVLIGKIRAKDQSGDFEWFICGEVPTDYLESAVAETPREIARHFAMKWQLNASRFLSESPEQNSNQITQDTVAKNLIRNAEDLYSLAEDDRLWLEQKTKH